MKDKRIVIIGGTSGIGLATGKAAATQGAQVAAAALMINRRGPSPGGTVHGGA